MTVQWHHLVKKCLFPLNAYMVTFMSNTIKKSWTVSNLHLLHCTDTLLWSLEFILASTISAILLLADDGIYHYKVKCYIGQGFLRFVNLKRSLVPHFAHIMLTILLLDQYLCMLWAAQNQSVQINYFQKFSFVHHSIKTFDRFFYM